MIFLKLTSPDGEKDVCVNMARVDWMQRIQFSSNTRLWFGPDTIHVRESPEEIMALIYQCGSAAVLAGVSAAADRRARERSEGEANG